MGALKREIGLFGATAYGVGIIVGAGVYALIGTTAGYAGNSVWLSFVLAATIASFTGLSYAELSSALPVSGGEYTYVKKSFESRFGAFLVGWLVAISGIISSATVALGFAGYFQAYVNLPLYVPAIAVIAILSVVNFLGIKESIIVNTILTIVEVAGLILIIVLGARFFGTVNYLETPKGPSGLIVATSLIFFAFTGFESLAKIGEETKDPKNTLPKALLFSLIISTLLYIGVAISAVSVVPYQQLANSTSPFVDVALKAQGLETATTLSIIALISTANTVLILLIATSRILYGMSEDCSLPQLLRRVHPARRTPWAAIILTLAVSVVFTLFGDIEFVASVTNFVTFTVFLIVNLALINLHRKNTVDKTKISKKLSIRGIPILAMLGVILSFVMLFQFSFLISSMALLLLFIGVLAYLIFRKRIEPTSCKPIV
ncbi:MAG: APC family permease [Chloroflexota bacterium]|nr:APC family permease [Candidatus Sulfotelmatobacter sp.]